MQCSEKHPQIEAQWNPKKGQQQQKLSDDVSRAPTDNTNGDSCPEEKALSRPKLRSLLAALSFEDPPKYLIKKKKKAKSMNGRPSLPPIDTSSHFVHRGTRVDSDESIFFDAEQYGDFQKDDFRLKASPRESVVLAGIKVAHHHHHGGDEHVAPAVETVLGQHHHHVECNNENTSSGSEDEFEYSEHEYNEFCGDCDNDEEKLEREARRNGSATVSATNSEMSVDQSEAPPPPQQRGPPLSPRPPNELPLRFLRAGKNNPAEGLRRYEATLKMRKDERVDTILREPSPDFEIIKKHYPHFCHLVGKHGEPCFYEKPPKTNLRALRDAGVTLDKLLRHYTMITEYQWQYLERDDLATSIYIIDLDGIRMTDFVGEAVDFVKRASAFSAQHYPERAGFVFVINVPGWFKLIWNVVKPIVDEDTLKKIYILRGKDEIRTAMQERIPLENIPPEYGGTSVPLGESPEEMTLAEFLAHNNLLAKQARSVCEHDCHFCKWVPARSY